MLSDINPVGGSQAPPPGPNSPPPMPEAQKPDYFQGGGWGAFKKWLGPANYAKFENNLCTAINHQIAKDKKQTEKAARELKKSETGKN